MNFTVATKNQKKNVFSFKYQNFGVRVNHTITHNRHNQTQLHKVNDLYVLFQNASTSQILEPSPQSLISSTIKGLSNIWQREDLKDCKNEQDISHNDFF